MKIIIYKCDRCGVESSDVMDPIDFNIKHGFGEHSMPNLENCCNDCRNGIIGGIVELFKPIKETETDEKATEKEG